MTERRRLERNLHDGAQQRLVALAVQLRVLEKRLGEPDKAIALLRGAATELEQALAELRELARGLHPAVLADRGLAAALETLASRSPLPLTLEGVPEGRLAEPLEAAAYFVVAESLTNAVKHAEAGEVRVRMATEAGELRVEIADDGRGGADPAGGGTGLRGLADRVEALGGRLDARVAARGGHDGPRGTSARADVTLAALPDRGLGVTDFDALYAAHRDDVWRYFRRRASADHEDLVTEVFLVAWRRREDVAARTAAVAVRRGPQGARQPPPRRRSP